MKKNVLFMLFGMIIATVTIVIADNLNASEIDYRDTKVDQALDTLYQKTTATEYDGSIEVTPSTAQQTLQPITTSSLWRSCRRLQQSTDWFACFMRSLSQV